MGPTSDEFEEVDDARAVHRALDRVGALALDWEDMSTDEMAPVTVDEADRVLAEARRRGSRADDDDDDGERETGSAHVIDPLTADEAAEALARAHYRRSEPVQVAVSLVAALTVILALCAILHALDVMSVTSFLLARHP